MEQELNEITDDVIGCNLSEMDLNAEISVSVRDLQDMLKEAYRAGQREGADTGN